MPDQKLTQLPVLAALSADDIFYVVDDPAGAASSRQVATSVFDARYLQAANNLSDLTNVVVARASLGLGTLAVVNDAPADGTIYGRQNNAWAAATGILPVVDTTAIVKGSADATKLLRFEVDGFTAGATRVATWPNADMTVAGLEVANVFTAVQTIQGPTATGIPLTVKTTDDNSTNPLLCLKKSGGANTATFDNLGRMGINATPGTDRLIKVAPITGQINARIEMEAGLGGNASFILSNSVTASFNSTTSDPSSNYALFNSVRGRNYFKILSANGNFGISIDIPTALLHIDQDSTTAAKPVITVDQADVSEEFIRFIGTSANGVLTQSIVENADVGAATLQGWLKVFVQDDGNQLADQAYFVPIYTLA